jgi:hypothetical protein
MVEWIMREMLWMYQAKSARCMGNEVDRAGLCGVAR